MKTLGLDIGGANIKAADNEGRAISRAFAIWNHPHRLTEQLAAILEDYPGTERVAVTMTAELADCFTTKSEGVRFILQAVEQSVQTAFPGRYSDVVVWSTDGCFLTCDSARASVFNVAAANWHALATWCSSMVPQGSAILVDIGSTTTDIIPLLNGAPVPLGLTDLRRLQSGELSYSAVWRTPLCAVAHSVPFGDGYCPLAAELFATMLDVYLLLGLIPEDSQNRDTANGQPATKTAAHDRIVRMLCCDRDEILLDDAVQIARFLADVQRQRLAGSLERVTQRLTSECATVILSGSGEFLARQLVRQNRKTSNCQVISLGDKFSPEIASAACAYAVAQLASERSGLS